MVNRSKVAVLGAGIGGLTAALKLQKETDAEITLFERGSAPGGRTRSITIDGNVYDIGATIITPHLIKLMKKEFGIEFDTIPMDMDIIATSTREPMRLDFGIASLEDIERILDEGTLSTIWTMSKIGIEGLIHKEDMDHMSAYDFLNELDDLTDHFKAYLAAGFIATNVSVGRLEATAFDLLAYSHDFQYPSGGVQQIADTLAATFIKRGGTIIYNMQVNEISDTGDEVKLVLQPREGGDTETKNYHHVISNIGVGHTLDALTNESDKLYAKRQKFESAYPTIQPTMLMYTMKEKPEFKGRSGLTFYYPLDTMDELNKYIGSIEDGEISINGFYIHYPAIKDPKASSKGEYPIQLWFPSTPNPSEETIQKFIEYGESEMDQYFIENFSEIAELVNVFKPMDAVPLYNNHGTVSQIGPHVGYPVFETELTENIYLAGGGAAIRMSPSTIQAQASGLVAASKLAEILNPPKSIWQRIKDFFS